MTPAEHSKRGSHHSTAIPQSSATRHNKIAIELSPAQVAHVIASAYGTSSFQLLRGPSDSNSHWLEMMRRLSRETPKHISGSLILGLLAFASFPRDGRSLKNVELARLLNVSQVTAHRYILTLMAVGLLERDPETRRYKLPAHNTDQHTGG